MKKERANRCCRRPKTGGTTKMTTAFLVLLSIVANTATAQGQQQRFFLPTANNGNFAVPRFQFQEDTDSAELIIPERRLSSAESLSNPGSSSFFPPQQQLPPGTFTNSGPFSRQPTAQQFILNGQQTQFQPIRNSGSLHFADAVSAVSQPSFFQQTPIQRQQQQQQQQQQFNFFPGNSQQQQQQQRFRPIVQQQHRAEQQDSIEHFDQHQNSQPSLTLQQSSQERDVSARRPVSQTNRNIPGARTPSPVGSVGWWNPSTADTEPVTVNGEDDTAAATRVNDDESNQQSQQQKRGRGQSQQGKRKPITAPVPSAAIPTLEQQHKPASIGFTVIHDDDDHSWSQPIITTHRPQPGQLSFRNRNPPTVAPGGSAINRRPTTYNPLSVVTTSTPVRSPVKPSESSAPTVDRQQATTVRNRKSWLFSTSTSTTARTLEDEEEPQEEELPLEEEREFLPRKTSTTTQQSPVPVTTLRSAIRPRLNSPAVSIPQQQQQQRMKKIVNNPAIIQSIVTTRKPPFTSTSALPPPKVVTNVPHQVADEYDEYEEYTTTPYTTTEQTSNKKQTKFSTVTQPSTAATNQKDNSSIGSTESWFVVASVQTSRSVSSSVNKNLTVNEAPTSVATTPTNKHRFNNNKPTTTTTTSTTTTVESIIDKLDRVQSELSNGILYGSSSTTNNSRILTDLQNGGGNNDKRNDVIISSFTNPTTEQTTENAEVRTTTSTNATSSSTTIKATSSSTTEKEEDQVDEDNEKEDEDEESDDSDRGTTFVRKFVPSKQRTTVATTTSTAKPLTQVGKKKSLIDSVKFDELLTSGLLPAGFNPKAPPAYKSKIITTTTTSTTTTETSLPAVTNSTSSRPNIGGSSSSSSSSTTTTTTPSTVKPKLPGLNIKFADDPSALASLLPPGFKLEDAIKPVESLSPSLLPPGYKPPAENADIANTNNGHESTSTTAAAPTTEASSLSSTTTAISTTGIVFPNSAKGSPGTRKPLPSSKKIQASVTVAPVIQKGWPVRASTEFTGWSTPSTTPLSIEKLLSQSKASEEAAVKTSTPEPTTSSTTTSTTTISSTTVHSPTTTPGQCSESDSVCELVGTVRLVGSGSEKWVPELLDHNTAEWRLLANEVENQLDKVYSKSPALSKWYKKITIDSFSPGNNGIVDGKPDKNNGVLVDFFVQLNQLGRTVSTADIRRLFHETLQKEGNLGSSAQPLQYGNGGNYEGHLKLGRFTVDPSRTDFIVLPKTTRGMTETGSTDDVWLPKWAVAVVVVGIASLLFVLIFGITVLVSRHKNNKKIPPPTVQTANDNHQHNVYGTSKIGTRHLMPHPPPSHHSNANYNISSYGYDNYAIDDDMLMLDEDDLEDRLYDMDAVWSDHEHEKHKIPPNSTAKKLRDAQHGGHYDSWRSTALAPQTLSPVQTGYYSGGGLGGYGIAEPSGYERASDRRHYHRDAATNPRTHHHYSHHSPSYTTGPRKPPQHYHPDYDTDF